MARPLNLPEAHNGAGDASQNESISEIERDPSIKSPRTDGPQVDDRNGTLKPAAYPRSHKLTTSNQTYHFIREDR